MINIKKNTIVCGDNLTWLNEVPDNSVDLCYIDPPFFSNKDYEIIWGNGYEVRSFGDRFAGGIGHYIEWMRPRIELIQSKLKATGSIFLHCDSHASHRLRVLLDDVFKEENFVNEIIWVRSKNPKGSQHKERSFSTFTDTILVYSKTKDFKLDIDKVRRPLTPEELAVKYDRKDEVGPFTDGPIIRGASMGVRPNLCYTYKGYKPGPYGWRGEKELIESIDAKGNLGWSATGKPYRKLRPEDDKGEVVSNIWFDISPINPQSHERLGYPTQKPEQLIRRIIEVSTNEGDIVMDCFGGGGTTAKVAYDLNRKFITGDVSPVAVRIMCERLSFDCPEVRFELKNLPRTIEGFKEIEGHYFAEMVCDLMGWKVNEKKSGDGGIDGWDGDGNPIQIKNHAKATGRADIQKFFGALPKSKKKVGRFVSWGFTRDAIEYIADVKRENGIEITPIKCEEIFSALLIDEHKQLELQELYKERRPKNWATSGQIGDVLKKAEKSKKDLKVEEAPVGKRVKEKRA